MRDFIPMAPEATSVKNLRLRGWLYRDGPSQLVMPNGFAKDPESSGNRAVVVNAFSARIVDVWGMAGVADTDLGAIVLQQPAILVVYPHKNRGASRPPLKITDAVWVSLADRAHREPLDRLGWGSDSVDPALVLRCW